VSQYNNKINKIIKNKEDRMDKGGIKKYYIAIDDTTNGKKRAYKEVEGEEVKVPGFEDFDFFYRRNGQFFEITELNTGLLVVSTRNKKTLLLEEAANVLKRYTKEEIKQTIKERIEQGFISPLCKGKHEDKAKAEVVKIVDLVVAKGFATMRLNSVLYKLQDGKVLDFKKNNEVGTYEWKQGKKGKYAEVKMGDNKVLFIGKTNGKFVVFKKFLEGGNVMSEDEKGGVMSIGVENNKSINIQK
jgi:hypothetical protein